MADVAEGATRIPVAGVCGAGVLGSLSPAIHNAWLRALGRPETYVALNAAPGSFGPIVDGLRHSGFTGLTVTLPFKEEAVAMADIVDPACQRSGAANLLLFDADGACRATDTDGPAVIAAIADRLGMDSVQGRVCMLSGSGGPAKSIAEALLTAGAAHVHILCDSPAEMGSLAEIFCGRITAEPFANAARNANGAAILINAVSAHSEMGEWWHDIGIGSAGQIALVLDLNFRPCRTALIQKAERAKLKVVDGLDLLIGQARLAFELLFGEPPPTIDTRELLIREGRLEPGPA